MTSWIVVVFLVFFNGFEGARDVDRGYRDAARLLGASPWRITLTLIIPSTAAQLSASLTPAICFAPIGVVVGEFIGAERYIGRPIIESEARAKPAGITVAVIAGVALSAVIKRLQHYLLRCFRERFRSDVCSTRGTKCPLQYFDRHKPLFRYRPTAVIWRRSPKSPQ